jgi:hypothetical protein
MALQAARITGRFAVSAASLSEALEAHARMERQLLKLRSEARREKQMNRRVELNLAVKRMEAEMAAMRAMLEVGEQG